MAAMLDQDQQTHAGMTAGPDPRRAFVFSVLAPGLGEYYAGKRLWGVTMLALFLLALTWSTWNGVSLILAARQGLSPDQAFLLPGPSLRFTAFATEALWLVSIFSALWLTTAGISRFAGKRPGDLGWGATMSWLCPGSGNLAFGAGQQAWALLLLALAGAWFSLEVYGHWGRDVLELVRQSVAQGLDLRQALKEYESPARAMRLHWAKAFKDVLAAVAVALTVKAALARKAPESDGNDSPWYRAVVLMALGWFSPGAGQAVRGERILAWVVLAGYALLRFMAALLDQGLAGGPQAVYVYTAAEILRWTAVLEGAVHAFGPHFRKQT